MLVLPRTSTAATPINVDTHGPNAMTHPARTFRAKVFIVFCAWAASAVLAGAAIAATARVAESDLSAAGFKVLAATTKAQEDWVRGLPAGKIRAMQRTGKKFFVYPDAPRSQIYVGGPAEYQAYLKLHPEHAVADAQKAAGTANAYRAQDAAAMQKATGRDMSDPFLGATWGDLGW